MQILKKSQFTGKSNIIEIDITPKQYEAFLNDHNGPVIQEYFPNLSADEREFLMTGATKEEWEKMFGGEK